MVSRKLPPPRLPTPPTEVTVGYITDLVRPLQFFITQEQNPGEMRGTKLVLTNLPVSDVGLEVGTLYRNENIVKVSVLDFACPDGSDITGSIGSVTISIS